MDEQNEGTGGAAGAPAGGTDGGGRTADAPTAARLTPYELAFLEGDFETRVFPGIQEEAEARREDPARRERFAFLAAGGEAIRDIIPPDAPPEMLEEYRALFYHAFNFWRFGRRLYVVDAAVARYLVEGTPTLTDWELSAPYDSLYIQLPPNLFWASIGTDVPPEPVDGFFVTVAREQDPLGLPFTDVQVLMVLGIHRLRAGFSVIAFDTEAGQGIPPVWAEPGRDRGRDFENVLPGGEMAGLYSILTTAEAFKLVARVLWYVQNHAEDVTGAPPQERRAEDRPGSVPFSRLEFHRVRLGDAG
ncbi:hypothetical protein [Longimicrobium sp.]|uniref:hypothetical protein n=1 Tax=Longimicrobium sp. TaxID=2029185 RepID=UPI002E31278A|nr:hypothetical protein [Longimicrobium sp.]HEX6038858.1 hypothetical protein [Longimicrobium sp.]